MNMQECIAQGEQYVMNTYKRLPIVLEKGEGCFVWDMDGNKYLDMVAGIAVNGLGHSPKIVVEAIQKQAEIMMHCSNLYWNKEQNALAEVLVKKSGLGKAFFCNSGAEANEAAIKLARKWGLDKGKYEIISLVKSFHGRTLGALAATAQEKYQKSFRPLPEGFKAVPAGDLAAMESAITPQTAAIMIEVVQGEGGVNIQPQSYYDGVQKLCEKYGVLLIVDEVQTGMGRTGRCFGFQNFGLKPDIISLAKALGGGFPMGAMVAKDEIAQYFKPGDHATTFGGTPLACAAGLAATSVLLDDKFLAEVREKGEYLRSQAKTLGEKLHGKISDIRGLGLIDAIELTVSAPEVSQKMLKKGILVNSIGEHILRLVPPLVITKEELDIFINTLSEVLAEM